MQLQQICYQAMEVKEPAVKKSSRVKKPENQKAEKRMPGKHYDI